MTRCRLAPLVPIVLLLAACAAPQRVDVPTRKGVHLLERFGVDKAEFEAFNPGRLTVRLRRSPTKLDAQGLYPTPDVTQCRIGALLIGHKIANIERAEGTAVVDCTGGLKVTLAILPGEFRLITNRPAGAESIQKVPR